jgi:hypothetical protein
MYDFEPEKPLRLVYGIFNLALRVFFTRAIEGWHGKL